MAADTPLIIFDMDGVLVDSSPCHRLAFDNLWQRLGISGPDYDQIAGRRTIEVVREWIPRDDGALPSPATIQAGVAFKQERALRYLRQHMTVFEDTLPVLQAVAEAGHTVGLGTGASRTATELVLQRLGSAASFDHVVTADDVRAGKPAPDVFASIIERASADPAETLVIEDSAVGISAGIAAGARVASVRSGQQLDHPRFVGAYADLAALRRSGALRA